MADTMDTTPDGPRGIKRKADGLEAPRRIKVLGHDLSLGQGLMVLSRHSIKTSSIRLLPARSSSHLSMP